MVKDMCVIFGAGKLGREAVDEIGNKKVLYFIDNNEKIYEKEINGIKVKNLQFYLNDDRKADIIIAVNDFRDIQHQLEENEIYN